MDPMKTKQCRNDKVVFILTIKKPVLALITMSVLMAFAGTPVFAADSTTGVPATTTSSTTSKPATTLASNYSTFAGSDANATALVNGLRTGTSITLTSGSGAAGTATTGSATFTPATSKLGYGNVDKALALAKTELTQMGITNPTPAQLQAALNGGTITTSTGTKTLPGILQMRADGKGWGAIAKSLGFKLGEVVSASKTDKGSADADKDKSVAKVDKVKAERPAKAERVEKVERVDQPKK